VLSAAACVAVAALMIIPDSVSPSGWEHLHPPELDVPAHLDILIITVYFVFSIVDLYVLQRHAAEPSRWKTVARVMAYVGLPTAHPAPLGDCVDLRSPDRPQLVEHIAYGSALRGSAVLSGTALVTLLALCAQRFGKVELSQETRKWLRGFIVISCSSTCSLSAPTT